MLFSYSLFPGFTRLPNSIILAVLMILLIRRLVAILAACGLAAGVLVYIGSYFGMTMDSLSRWTIIVLSLGLFVFLLPIFSVEYPALVDRTFFSKVLYQGMPKWVDPAIKLLTLFFAIHFCLFMIQRGADLRLLATSWIFFYFVPTMYWWFPRKRDPNVWKRPY